MSLGVNLFLKEKFDYELPRPLGRGLKNGNTLGFSPKYF